MKLYTAIVAFSVFISWFTVHAEEVQMDDYPAAPTMVYRESSEANRISKKWTIVGQLFGAGSNGSAQQGVAAGYYIDRNSIVQLEAGSGSVNGNTFLFVDDKYELSGTAIGIHFKHFLSNSFYIKAGLDYRETDYSYRYAWSLNRIGFKGNSVNASVIIGNQWQWQNFTWGCDWIGYSLPLTSSVTSETNTDTSDPYYSWDLNESEKKYLKNGFAQALRLYVGASF